MIKNIFLSTLLFVCIIMGTTGFSATHNKQRPLIVCKGTYALCTFAKCMPSPNDPKKAICKCKVKQGYSASDKACVSPIKKFKVYKLIRSRYYPIQSGYVYVCNTNYPWAACLNAPCIVGPDNPKVALCSCNLRENQPGFIIRGVGHSLKACTSGIYSSTNWKRFKKNMSIFKQQNILPIPTLKVYQNTRH